MTLTRIIVFKLAHTYLWGTQDFPSDVEVGGLYQCSNAQLLCIPFPKANDHVFPLLIIGKALFRFNGATVIHRFSTALGWEPNPCIVQGSPIYIF